jgi:hypothetical protein
MWEERLVWDTGSLSGTAEVDKIMVLKAAFFGWSSGICGTCKFLTISVPNPLSVK